MGTSPIGMSDRADFPCSHMRRRPGLFAAPGRRLVPASRGPAFSLWTRSQGRSAERRSIRPTPCGVCASRRRTRAPFGAPLAAIFRFRATLSGVDDGGAEVIDGGRGSGGGEPEVVALHEAAQTRYLNYALSVITSRALPDVRDGLKPVQRRILYTMWQQNLTADVKHRKCAKVVGDVMGNYHPHGDTALYETLVRMAQSFSLRYPLVDGSGNFGSLDGDSAAAMRYTECRLARAVSDELLTEIDQTTVPFRPNYDGTKTEPVVLPSRIPNLLINGATGIAVGMATNIPPHNLTEVCTALIKLLDNPDLTSVQLCRYVKGPDFPTGGEMLNSPEELKEIYKTGSGAIRLRAHVGDGPGDARGEDDLHHQRPVHGQQVDARRADRRRRAQPQAAAAPRRPDLSTDDVRIALELKKDADEKMVMAYLFKHTPLQTNFSST